MAMLGALVFLAPMKFGTPVIAQSLLPMPHDIWEWVISSWPNPLLVILSFVGLIWAAIGRPGNPTLLTTSGSGATRRRLNALAWLPLAWLLTQVVATPRSSNIQVSFDTLLHFAVCVVVFYAAARLVRNEKVASWVFGALAAATAVTGLLALLQWFGGLAAAREYAAAYFDPATISDDLRLRMTSNRVFGTLVYPNALAGFLVVAFAPVLAWLYGGAWRRATKVAILALAGGAMVYCLMLTGSRGGFAALAAAVAAGALCLVRGRTVWRVMVVGLVVLAAFVIVFLAAQRGGLMHLGRQSLEARLDYWSGAARIVRDHPWLGTGPGTFGSIYTKYKTATTEEAQFAHNNYLEMWCDSGVAAFMVFVVLWVVAVWDAFRLARRRRDMVSTAVCAALVGWTVHGLVDFDLYVPGIAVPAFALLGVLQGLKGCGAQETGEGVQGGNHKRLLLLAAAVGLVSVVTWFEGRMLAAHLAYGESLAATNWPTAITGAERAAALAPRNAVYQMTAGKLLVSAGQFAEGLRYCRRAVEDDPQRASYHYRLAGALAMAGRPAIEVSQELRRAVELNPTKTQYREVLRMLDENR